MPKFKKRIYITWDADGRGIDPPWMAAYSDFEGAAELNADVKVGVYELIEVKTVTAKAELVCSKRRR